MEELDAGERREEGGRRRGARWWILHFGLPAAVLAGYVLLVLLRTEDYWMPEWDGATYLVVAKALAAGEGYSYQGEPFFLRPPGMSWLLSFLAEPGGFDPFGVNLLVMAFAGLAVPAAFLMVRALHDTWTALAAALLAGSCSLWLDLHNWVFSEFPFTVLAFAALACFQLAARSRSRAWVGWLAGALLLAAAVHLRTVGVLLLPGVAALGALRGRGRSRLAGVAAALAVCLALVPWLRYSSAAAARAEAPAEQTLLFDYTTAMFHVDTGDPSSPRVDLGGWVERIRENGDGLLGDLAEAVLHADRDSVAARVVLVVTFLLGLIAAVRRRGASLLEWFALSYAALVFTYFTYDSRLAQPLVPLVYLYLLVAAAGAGRWLAERLGRPRLGGGVLVAANLLLLAVALAPGGAREGTSRRAFADSQQEIARWIRENTPPDARILCNLAPVFALLTGRHTSTYRYMRSRRILARTRPDYVVFDGPAPAPFIRQVENRGVESFRPAIGPEEYTLIVRIR